MAKTKQSASLGTISNYAGVTPFEDTNAGDMSIDARVEALEQRVSTLEGLVNQVLLQLNDVVVRLDTPLPPQQQKNKPSQAKSKQKHKQSKDEWAGIITTHSDVCLSVIALLSEAGEPIERKALIEKAQSEQADEKTIKQVLHALKTKGYIRFTHHDKHPDNISVYFLDDTCKSLQAGDTQPAHVPLTPEESAQHIADAAETIVTLLSGSDGVSLDAIREQTGLSKTRTKKALSKLRLANRIVDDAESKLIRLAEENTDTT